MSRIGISIEAKSRSMVARQGRMGMEFPLGVIKTLWN
jgi:hypothetical protein